MSVSFINPITFTLNNEQRQPPKLTELLKDKTKLLHAAVENTSLMKGILERSVTKEEYSAQHIIIFNAIKT